MNTTTCNSTLRRAGAAIYVRRFTLALGLAVLLSSTSNADWSIKTYSLSDSITGYAAADALIAGNGLAAGYPVSASYAIAYTQDNFSNNGYFGLGEQIAGLPPGNNDNFAFVGQGTLTVLETGDYFFGTSTDDGSRVRISVNGGLPQQVITDDVLSPVHIVESSLPLSLTAGDTLDFEWMWFECSGDAEGAFFYSKNGYYTLIGDSIQGLSLPNGFTGTVYKATEAQIHSFADADLVKATPGSERGSELRSVFNVVDWGVDSTDGQFLGGQPSPGMLPGSQYYLSQGTGLLVVGPDQAGQYIFRSINDDGSRFRIDMNQDGDFDDQNETPINDDVQLSPHFIESDVVSLTPGSYPIEYSFFNAIFGGEGEISASRLEEYGNFILLGDQSNGGLSVIQVPETETLLLSFISAVLLVARCRYRPCGRLSWRTLQSDQLAEPLS